MANNKREEFVLSLDVGTTNIRAFIYDQTGAIRGHDNDKVSAKLHFFKVTYVQVSTYCLFLIIVNESFYQRLISVFCGYLLTYVFWSKHHINNSKKMYIYTNHKQSIKI